MERLKESFAGLTRRGGEERLEKADVKESKFKHRHDSLVSRGPTGTIPAVCPSKSGVMDVRRELNVAEINRHLTLKDFQLMSEQKESVFDGRVTEGDGKGANWVMESARPTAQGFRTVKYTTNKTVGSGSFGIVFQAMCVETGQMVAIKRVRQDRRFKNRELQIMKMIRHPNVVQLYHSFSATDEAKDTYLMLVCEYVPDTVHRICRHYTSAKSPVPLILVKVYVFQICRSLAFIHRMGICHRDIKPQNLLVNSRTHELKLCDFGSAKVLMPGEPNIAYICSRYYRAPELIFGATEYSTAVDTWSVGCVMAELLLGSPIFPGESGVDQLVEIMNVLGTPSKEEISIMNPGYTEYKFPQFKPHSLQKRLGKVPEDALDLVSSFLVYDPSSRITLVEALAHPFFDELRNSNTRLPCGGELPPLFNWQPGELDQVSPDLVKRIQGHCL